MAVVLEHPDLQQLAETVWKEEPGMEFVLGDLCSQIGFLSMDYRAEHGLSVRQLAERISEQVCACHSAGDREEVSADVDAIERALDLQEFGEECAENYFEDLAQILVDGSVRDLFVAARDYDIPMPKPLPISA